MREAFIPSVVDLSRRIHVLEYGGRWYARTRNSTAMCTFWRTPRGDWAYQALVPPPDGLSRWETANTIDYVEDISNCARFLENQDRYLPATEL